jgi:hypothetical protein
MRTFIEFTFQVAIFISDILAIACVLCDFAGTRRYSHGLTLITRISGDGFNRDEGDGGDKTDAQTKSLSSPPSLFEIFLKSVSSAQLRG